MDSELEVKSLPSSFVYNDMKLRSEAGAGEAKLFIGPKRKSKEYDDFFEFENDYKYLFDKENLIEYLNCVKIEYHFQKFNKYKNVNLNIWQDNYNKIMQLNDDLAISLEKFEDDTRYYVRAQENIFKKILRQIALPKLTNIKFEKNIELKHITIKLGLNYDFSETISEKEYSEKELEQILLTYYNDDEYKKMNGIRLFGLKFGKLIKKKNYKTIDMVRNTGLQESLAQEIDKGVWLSQYVSEVNEKINLDNIELIENREIKFITNYDSSFPRNRIVFGAPGTGKSWTINKEKDELLKR